MAIISYSTLSANFERVKNLTVSQVGTFIGGKIEENIKSGSFQNACAIRLSYAFNYSGLPISRVDGATSSGKDKKLYLYRVTDLRKFVEKHIGRNPIKGKTPKDFYRKKGIIVFSDCPWNNATGHIDLFDGIKVEGSPYWGECKSAVLYELK